jgi:hypothetical protein
VAISKVGDVLVLNMFNDEIGEYVMENRVVGFKPERRIVWEPVMRSIDKPEFHSHVVIRHITIGDGNSNRWTRSHPGHRVLRPQPFRPIGRNRRSKGARVGGPRSRSV